MITFFKVRFITEFLKILTFLLAIYFLMSVIVMATCWFAG
jgi:hypothetical protein